MANKKGMHVSNLDTPCMLLYESGVRQNCQAMLDRCKTLGVQLRPHMKTHKTVEGGLLMTNGSRRCIAVSTVAEAEFYADNGFEDILYAYPLVGKVKIERVQTLHRRLESFHIMLDHDDQLQALLSASQVAGTTTPWSVFIDVDVGYGRTGVDPNSASAIALAQSIASNPLTFLAGVYVHCGHSYHCKSAEEIRRVATEAGERAVHFAEHLRQANLSCAVVGIGSTPSCSQPPASLPGITEFHPGNFIFYGEAAGCSSLDVLYYITEFHPGNFIFYDLQQHWAGSCKREDIAIRVMTRVVSHYPDRNRLVIDCGFTAISKQNDPETGCYALFDGHPELKLVGMSQELGMVGGTENGDLDLSKYPIGSLLYILPYHACAVAGLHATYHVVDTNDVCSAVWTPCRGW